MEWKFFRRILASLFPTPKYQISFLDEGNSKNISKPDAYVIKGKHHLLFEFKDSMTNSNILETNDFSKIYKNLLRNYATERSSGSKKTQNKGIYQLLDFIKNRIINSSNIKNLSIYPILVVTDDTLMTPGTRDFLNNIWTFEISKLEISNRISIKPLALIHLSTVFNLAFSERKEFDFVGLLLKYYQKVASRNKRISKEKNLSHGLKYSDSFENVLGLDSPPGYGFNVLKFKAFITELGMSIYL